MYGIQKDGDIQQIAGNSHIVADDALSTTSENPIQNKVVTNALAGVPIIAHEETTTSTTPRDADTLGGHAASYFATNDSLNNLIKRKEITVTTGSNGYFGISNFSGAIMACYAYEATNYLIHMGYNSGNGTYMGFITDNSMSNMVADTTVKLTVFYI